MRSMTGYGRGEARHRGLKFSVELTSVNRKLADIFLCQELQREANTVASKANDTAISRSAVVLKAEFERIREQVQNIE